MKTLFVVSFCSIVQATAVAHAQCDHGNLFEDAWTFSAGDNPNGIALDDFNGDGNIDIVAVLAQEHVARIWFGNGDGTFDLASSSGVGDLPAKVGAGDLNGDGAPDIVTSNYFDEDISILINQGDGTFAEEYRLDAETFPRSVVLADLTGNGCADIVVANLIASVSVYRNVCNGTILNQVVNDMPGNPYSAVVADFDNDGAPDIATGIAADGEFAISEGSGSGFFSEPEIFAAPHNAGVLTAGDFDGDGNNDVVAVGGGLISTFLGNGHTNFAAPMTSDGCDTMQSIRSIDLNHDQVLDVVVVCKEEDRVGLFIGQGDGSFEAASFFPVGVGPEDVRAADLNGDGAIDLVTADVTGDTISVLLNRCVPCVADLDDSSHVDVNDLLLLLSAWGPCSEPCEADLNSDQVVDVTDLLSLLASWGICR